MKIEEQLIFWMFVTIPMIIIYFVAASFLISFKNNLEKDNLFRKILLYLSIIPIVNLITMMLLILGVVFKYFIRELIDIVREIKNEFKNEKN